MSAADLPERDAAKIAADLAAAVRIQAAIDYMIRIVVDGWRDGFTAGGYDAVHELAAVLGREMSEAAMNGAASVLKAADAATRAAGAPTIESVAGQLDGALAGVPPTKAIEALLKREPRLATSANEVARLYQGDRAFAIAKSVELEVTQKVHGAIVEALRSGAPTDVASRVVADLGEWSQGYATTVTRTNLMTAYSGGQDLTAKMPGVRDVMVGYEVTGPVDSSTRPNHAAYVGFRAPLDSPEWRNGPIYGFNCRHSKTLIDRFRAAREGWLDAGGNLIPMTLPRGAHPDKGFRPQG